MSDGLYLTREMAKKYGARGGVKVAATKTWHVEGEWLTTAQLAKHLGTSHYAAYKRMRRLTKLNMPITWSALRLEKKK